MTQNPTSPHPLEVTSPLPLEAAEAAVERPEAAAVVDEEEEEEEEEEEARLPWLSRVRSCFPCLFFPSPYSCLHLMYVCACECICVCLFVCVCLCVCIQASPVSHLYV